MLELLPLILGIVLAQASPGPNLLAVASVSLGSGRAAGLLTVAGIASGVLVWAVLFAFGAAALVAAFPWLVTAMKLVGGGYLLYLAMRALLAARAGVAGTVARDRKVSGLRAYLTGLGVVLTNPKAALMWVAIALFLASSQFGTPGYLGVGVFAALSAMAVYGSYALVFSTGGVSRLYGRMVRWVQGLFAILFGAVGGRLVFEGLAELRR